jgi:hypothetical protein
MWTVIGLDWKQLAVNKLTTIKLPNGQMLLEDPRPAAQPVLWWEFALLLDRIAQNLPKGG